MARVALLTTGGTIASSRAAGSDRVVANIAGAALRASLRDPLEGIDIEVEDFASVGSFAIDLPLAFRLARRVEAILSAGVHDGVVVTHGTDTMEESCYMADLLLSGARPAVFTGAQRHAGDTDTDGPRNIADAVRLAAAPEASNLGAVIVFEQQVHAVREVTKAHTSRTDTFRSASYGKLGEVDGKDVFIHRRPLNRQRYDPPCIVPEVELMKLVMGASPAFLDYAAGEGARGFVIEAFGRGNTPPGFPQAIERLAARGIPIVIASRCHEGYTRPVYGGGSGGKDLEDAGAIFAGDLAGPKARILLAVLLGLDMDVEAVRGEFAPGS